MADKDILLTRTQLLQIRHSTTSAQVGIAGPAVIAKEAVEDLEGEGWEILGVKDSTGLLMGRPIQNILRTHAKPARIFAMGDAEKTYSEPSEEAHTIALLRAVLQRVSDSDQAHGDACTHQNSWEEEPRCNCYLSDALAVASAHETQEEPEERALPYVEDYELERSGIYIRVSIDPGGSVDEKTLKKAHAVVAALGLYD